MMFPLSRKRSRFMPYTSAAVTGEVFQLMAAGIADGLSNFNQFYHGRGKDV